jgi:tetratricopeptide (TPR) repeat protein
VALVVAAVHASGLGGSFHFDDGHSLLRNPSIRSLAQLPRFLSDPTAFSEDPAFAMYRPLVLVSYAFDYARAGYQASAFLLTNLGCHVLACVCLYALGRQLGLAWFAAGLAAVVFGLHPQQTEVTHYISSRSESLAGLFGLAALVTALAGDPRLGRRRQRGWLAASLGCTALALMAKTTAVVLPILLLLLWRLGAGDRRPWYSVWPWATVTAVYSAVYWVLTPQGVGAAAAVRPWLTQWATQLKALVWYGARATMPVHLSVYPQFEPGAGAGGLPLLLALAALASLVGLVARLRRLRPWLTMAVVWPAVCLLPTLIIPLHVLVSDHRVYLAAAGPCLALARHAHGRQRIAAALVLCLAMALATIQRAPAWRDEASLWQDAVEAGPRVPEAHYNLGHQYHLAGQWERARACYEEATRLSPAYARAQANLGALDQQQGRLADAAQRLTMALAAEPDMVEALANLGSVRRQQGQLDQAEALLRRALALRPDAAEAELNLGLTLRDQGRLPEAAARLRRALELDPDLRQRVSAPSASAP